MLKLLIILVVAAFAASFHLNLKNDVSSNFARRRDLSVAKYSIQSKNVSFKENTKNGIGRSDPTNIVISLSQFKILSLLGEGGMFNFV